MITSFLPKSSLTPFIVTLFMTIQLSACGAEDLITAITPDVASGADSVVTVTGTAKISGTNTGSVIKDVDPDGDDLLEVSGKLDITDDDAGEAAFVAKKINGNYGDLDIDTSGSWNYAADNNQAAIQDLDANATLTDTLTVSSIDGTTSTVSITIIGTDDIIPSANIDLSWIAPVEREDNSALSLSAIAGYKVYFGTTQGQYPDSITINDGSAVNYTFQSFTSGTYYFVVTTIDTEGRESGFSTEVVYTI